MNEVIFAPIILEILSIAQSVTSLSKITQSLTAFSNPEAAQDVVSDIAYHVMWCIKQGLIQPRN